MALKIRQQDVIIELTSDLLKRINALMESRARTENNAQNIIVEDS